MASNSAAWSGWMSMKKKLGAASGRRSSSWRVRLRSIATTATSTVRPKPNDSTTLAVGAPGR